MTSLPLRSACFMARISAGSSEIIEKGESLFGRGLSVVSMSLVLPCVEISPDMNRSIKSVHNFSLVMSMVPETLAWRYILRNKLTNKSHKYLLAIGRCRIGRAEWPIARDRQLRRPTGYFSVYTTSDLSSPGRKALTRCRESGWMC